MPGLSIFLPSLELPPFVCRNCGYWQRALSTPCECPVCKDYRHILPPTGWSFYNVKEAQSHFPTLWEEMIPGLWRFWNNPVDGIGSHAYLLQNPAGNLMFEGATIYSEEALEQISKLGGVKFASASHPHTYGALWQLQDYFDADIIIHKEDLIWTNAFRVMRPFEGSLEIIDGISLINTGIHFSGHSILYDANNKILFSGDAMKIDLVEGDPRSASAISSHKSFVRGIPITKDEISHYRAIFNRYSFDKVYTPFEQVHDLNNELIDKYYSQLSDLSPKIDPIALKNLLP